jgi:hypothetical protein
MASKLSQQRRAGSRCDGVGLIVSSGMSLVGLLLSEMNLLMTKMK